MLAAGAGESKLAGGDEYGAEKPEAVPEVVPEVVPKVVPDIGPGVVTGIGLGAAVLLASDAGDKVAGSSCA